ncbi:GNAT family N-acetyltransferase [Vibrio diazotrophicus]|uniref:GNAT family N-acetyltransferase n=1 Tax=Vibrio diazotrophicus TaxID=685 RepID=UPI000C9E40CE|nr:GNAT family N-acetyltransferase [Vibrio diazotrophicus]MCZ4371651.1 GNAT family N-acetyltransferase [Vibrio diazotrophicus]PNH93943.1 GNAT family N-acetyltransferase [Vibrio diazotrophicus]
MIQTERLELRKFHPQDRELMLPLLQDAEFMAFSPNGAMTAEQAEIRFQQLVDAFPEKGVGKFCVIERSSGELIGYCGIESFTYQNKQVVEHGYRLKTSARGNGYATEASKAVMSYAKEAGYTRIYAFTESSHSQSQHILGKLGFKPCGSGEYQNMPVNYFIKRL